jgi:hypothetical protein
MIQKGVPGSEKRGNEGAGFLVRLYAKAAWSTIEKTNASAF